MREVNICYLDFWPGFDVNCNWFNLVFKDCFPKYNFIFDSSPEDADIIMSSSFGQKRLEYKDSKAIKIFYTGENEPPEFLFADYTLSFDFNSHNGKNFRLPHWMLYINWWNEPNFPHARILPEQLTKQWDVKEVWNRPEFCAIIIGNPVFNRLDIAQKLNYIGSVHGYGKVFGKYYDGDKLKLLENYRWNICFENSITDGYITEKLLEAKIAGCVPIYYGSASVKQDFNEKCCINYNNFKNAEDLVEIIKKCENKLDFIEIAKEPLFNVIPTLDNLYNFLRERIKL
jgi:hypothetical protein